MSRYSGRSAEISLATKPEASRMSRQLAAEACQWFWANAFGLVISHFVSERGVRVLLKQLLSYYIIWVVPITLHV